MGGLTREHSLMHASFVELSAIMRYHAIKMEEINEQIKYLWSKTYQGTGACWNDTS